MGRRPKGPNEYREVTIAGAEAVEMIIESPKYGTHITIVDKEEYPRVKDFRWHIWQGPTDRTFYARANIPHPDGTARRTIVQMHRHITNAPKGMVVDHINHNGLDNRKSNLRVCTIAENSRNRRRQKGGTSIYKGVNWQKAKKKWHARIKFEGKHMHIGYFTDDKEEEAARAVDAKAKELHGEYAYLNFPDE